MPTLESQSRYHFHRLVILCLLEIQVVCLDQALPVVPQVTHLKANVLIASDVTFYGVLNGSLVDDGGTSSWRKDFKLIGNSEDGRIRISFKGYRLFVNNFQSSDVGTYTFQYRSNNSNIITHFETQANDAKPQNTSNIAGTIIGLLLIFMVLFVVVFYCCRGGITPIQALPMTRSQILSRGTTSKALSKARDVESTVDQFQGRCLYCFDNGYDSRQQSYVNIGPVSTDDNKNEKKLEINETYAKETTLTIKAESSVSKTLHEDPCELERLVTDV